MARQRERRPWWLWVIVGFVVLLIIGAIFGEDPSQEAATETTTVTVSQPAAVAESPTEEPIDTLSDARQAVDADDYARAVQIASALPVAEVNAIGSRISNRIAKRVHTALRAGDRSRASALLRQAGRYPATEPLLQARASYKAAKARAAERARQRRLASEQRRQQRAAEREQRRQERDQEQAEQLAPSAPSGGTCADTPATDFPVPPGDPRDRDGDGIACES
jgi:hypothetical protein